MERFCVKCLQDQKRKNWHPRDLCSECNILLDKILDFGIKKTLSKNNQPERSKREDIKCLCKIHGFKCSQENGSMHVM